MDQTPEPVLPVEEQIALQAKMAADLMAQIEEARRSPLALYQLLFTDESGKPVVIKFFHKEWEQLILKNRLVMIRAARELTKTSFMLAAVLWMLGQNINIRIKWLGENDISATKRLGVIHSVIDNSPVYKHVFPHVVKVGRSSKRPNNVTMLNLERGIETPEPTIEALGVTSAGTGGRADLIVMDDIVGESNSILKPSMMPKVLNKVQSDWLATLVGGGRVWNIHSPWHENDANNWLWNNATWECREYHHGKPGDPYYSIFPERWPRARLLERRAWYGELHYARAYLCKLFTVDTVIVMPQHLRRYGRSVLTPDKLQRATAVISIDPSKGKDVQKGKTAYVGLTVLLFVDNLAGYKPVQFDEQGNPWPPPPNPPFEIFTVESYQIKVSTRLQVKLLWEVARTWAASYILVENEGMQTLAEWLQEEQRQNPLLGAQIMPVQTKGMGKGARLLAITPLLDRPEGQPPILWFHPDTISTRPLPQNITLPDGSQAEILRDLREQVLSFPTPYMDILDSWTQGVNWIWLNLAPKQPGAERKTRLRTTVISL